MLKATHIPHMCAIFFAISTWICLCDGFMIFSGIKIDACFVGMNVTGCRQYSRLIWNVSRRWFWISLSYSHSCSRICCKLDGMWQRIKLNNLHKFPLQFILILIHNIESFAVLNLHIVLKSFLTMDLKLYRVDST